MNTMVTASILFLALVAVGYIMSLTLYKKRGKAANAKELRNKILMWIPIYLLFAIFIISNQLFQVLVALFIAYHIVKEVRANINRGYPFAVLYFALLVSFGLVALWLMVSFSLVTTLAIVFSTMLAEEIGQFAHSFSRKNSKNFKLIRSKESLFGQLVGALIGGVLVFVFIGQFDLWVVAAALLGVFIGDTTNRFIKTKLRLSSWSSRLKSHGGYLDRFAALSFAAISVYLFYFI